MAVLAAFNRTDLDADNLDAVFLEHAGPRQLRAEIEAGLAAEVRQQGVGALFGHDLRHALERERLDIGYVRHAWIGHDRRRVGIDQHDLIAEGAQGFAGLGAGVVEFAGLTDHNRPGPDNHDFLDVFSFWHWVSPVYDKAQTKLLCIKQVGRD